MQFYVRYNCPFEADCTGFDIQFEHLIVVQTKPHGNKKQYKTEFKIQEDIFYYILCGTERAEIMANTYIRVILTCL